VRRPKDREGVAILLVGSGDYTGGASYRCMRSGKGKSRGGIERERAIREEANKQIPSRRVNYSPSAGRHSASREINTKTSTAFTK